MATVIHAASGFSRFNPFPGLIAGMVARWHAHRHRARELRDLGLSRSDFISIRNGTYRRD